jgi:hypothetical protein
MSWVSLMARIKKTKSKDPEEAKPPAPPPPAIMAPSLTNIYLHNILNQLKLLTGIATDSLAVEEKILAILDQVFEVRDFELFQFQGDQIMAITGVQVGGTGTFQISFVPPNGVPLSSGPTVAADDPLVTLSAVDSNSQFTASVGAGDTGTSFNITVSGMNGATPPVALSHVFNVPILAAPPLQITDFGLDQIS